MAGAKRRKRRDGRVFAPIVALLGIIGLAATMVGTYAFVYKTSTAIAVDEHTLCPKAGPVAHLAIIVDTTDPLSPTQLEAARQQIDFKIANAAVKTRISFSTVDPDQSTRQATFFSMCKPPSGEDASILTQNPRMIEERFQAEFAKPVQDAMKVLMGVPESDSSPIMESTQEFATRIPGFTVTDVPRELLIMSDLVQHSDNFSFYRGDDWERFSKGGGPARFGNSFEGASVTVLRIPRLSESASIIDDFWHRYFNAQGFQFVRVKTIGDL